MPDNMERENQAVVRRIVRISMIATTTANSDVEKEKSREREM